MIAWPAPQLPRLRGRAHELSLYDTATGQRVTVTPDPGRPARMYVCGITPYDATHIGHAATYVAFDLVQRVWRDAGHDVVFVQNVTDVDDPLLERADATGEDWQALAARQTELFREDMTALAIMPPDHYIGAVESIPDSVELIADLTARGATYEVDGDIYLSVREAPSFGTLSHLEDAAMATLSEERGGDPSRSGKKDPLDSLLWQLERPGEPAWDSPFGRGRPGWHVECTAIALRYLGMTFDVQGGGSDLMFPHHEMCAATAQVAAPDGPFAKTYVHSGMVALDGAKMSKSKGNLVFVSRLRAEGREPGAIRLSLLSRHYRSDWEWTDQVLIDAEARLARWREAARIADRLDTTELLEDVRVALAADLDAPAAVAAVDAWTDRTLGAGGLVSGAKGFTGSVGLPVRDITSALLGVRL